MANTLKGEEVVVEMAGYHSRNSPTVRAIQPHEIQVLAQPTEEEVEEDRKAVQKLIPACYHHHWQVFSEWALY